MKSYKSRAASTFAAIILSVMAVPAFSGPGNVSGIPTPANSATGNGRAIVGITILDAAAITNIVNTATRAGEMVANPNAVTARPWTSYFVGQRINISNYEYLIIGGDGIDPCEIEVKKELILLCENLNITQNVVFLGNINRQEVKANLDACHAFLIASKYETFGVVLIEALASGRPVITTNSKGPMDIIDKQNGILLNSWKATDFADCMKDLVRNYTMYNRIEISNNCKNKFGEDFIINQLISLYKKYIPV